MPQTSAISMGAIFPRKIEARKAVVFLQVSNCAFRGSTGVPRQCFGAPDLLEQRENGLEKSNRTPGKCERSLSILRGTLIGNARSEDR